MKNAARCLSDVTSVLERDLYTYDIIIIDGLYREQLAEISDKYLSPGGVIICDNSESYETHERFVNLPYKRVDFYGNAAGVVLPHCTSIFFKDDPFLMSGKFPIVRNSMPIGSR